MNYNIETSESFDKQAKRLQKHYASLQKIIMYYFKN